MNLEHNSRVQLRHWVLAKNGKIRPEELDDHTPILEQRIITSLQVMVHTSCLVQRLCYQATLLPLIQEVS